MIDPPFDEDPRKCFKDHALKACAWYIPSLNRKGAATQLIGVSERIQAEPGHNMSQICVHAPREGKDDGSKGAF